MSQFNLNSLFMFPKSIIAVRAFFFNLFFFSFAMAFCQDYHWWNIKHNWDGVTSWTQYINYQPKYLGPNALPVPEIRNGNIQTNVHIENAALFHFSKGDKTQTLLFDFFYPFENNKIAIEAYWLIYENFETDTLTRDMRKARTKSGKGGEKGDLYISTIIQIIENRRIFPDISLGINLKTASGGGLSDARATDAPGYYFDVAMGKSFKINKGAIKQIRPFSVLGFYVWQNNRGTNYQNDAILYGLGVEFYSERNILKVDCGGYSGYFNDGDRPFVFRIDLKRIINVQGWGYHFRYQKGNTDYNYNSFQCGIIYQFKKKEVEHK